MRALLSLVLLAAISNAANAQSIQRIDIVEFGIYQVKVTGHKSAPGTAQERTDVTANEKLLEATTRVPLRLGVDFGFRYKIVGRTGRPVSLKIVAIVPQPGIRNPDTGNTIVRNEYSVDRTVGSTYYTGFTADHPWEIVTGTWTFEIWDDDRKLASQSFNVVAP